MTIPPDAERLIEGEPLIAHLATSLHDRPHVAPVWYDYADGVVRIVTAGRKVENVRGNPRVAISIQKDRDGDALWFVTIRGTARVVEDVARINEAARTIYGRYLGPDPAEWDDYYRESLGDDPPNDLVVVEVGSATYDVYED